jgi:hypothetical protein
MFEIIEYEKIDIESIRQSSDNFIGYKVKQKTIDFLHIYNL